MVWGLWGTTRARRGRCGAEAAVLCVRSDAEAAVLCVRSGGGSAVAGQPTGVEPHLCVGTTRFAFDS